MKAKLSTAVRGLAIAAAVGLSFAATTTASEAKTWTHNTIAQALSDRKFAGALQIRHI